MKLVLCDVSKTIRGNRVLDHVSLVLESGKIYGLVGPNASGKTMLMRAISGLIRIDEGEIRLDGKVLKKDFQVLPSLGLILENAGMYDHLTGLENLRELAAYKGTAGEEDMVKAIRRVGLNPEDKRRYSKYSLGMKQKLAIAQAIMEEPDVLLLDEPTNALDQESVKRIETVLKEERDRGALIILSSHYQEHLNTLADYIIEIAEGRIVSEKKEIE